MKANFDLFLSEVLKHEGGYVNHPKDPGGPTNLGVTLGVAKRLGIDVDGDGDTDIVDIKKLSRSDAGKVFKAEYWDKVRGDELPSGVDIATGDFAVNSGVSRASSYLQEIVGVAPDGKIGPLTIAAAKKMSAVAIVNRLCDNRLAFLKRLSTFSTFGKGWTARVADVRALSSSLASKVPGPIPTATLPASVPSGTKPRGVAVLIAVILPILYGIGKALGIVP